MDGFLSLSLSIHPSRPPSFLLILLPIPPSLLSILSIPPSRLHPSLSFAFYESFFLILCTFTETKIREAGGATATASATGRQRLLCFLRILLSYPSPYRLGWLERRGGNGSFAFYPSLHPSILYGNGSFAFYESLTAGGQRLLCFLILNGFPLRLQRQRLLCFLSIPPSLHPLRQRLLCFLRFLNGFPLRLLRLLCFLRILHGFPLRLQRQR